MLVKFMNVQSKKCVMSVTSEELYAKDKNLRPKDVKTIQEWLKTQPHLPQVEEYQIIVFLHCCYYQIEAAKTTIDKYFSIRTGHPNIFNHLDEGTLRNAMKFAFNVVLPGTTPEGYTILLMKLYSFDTTIYKLSHIATLLQMVWALFVYQHGFDNGCIIVIDSKGFSFRHLLKTDFSVVKPGLSIVQEGAPVRIKGFHVINVVPATERLKILVKPFMKNELYNMIQFHSSIDTLFNYVPQELLPEDYGGKAPSTHVLQERNLRNLLDNYEYFEWHDSQKVDESKRCRKSKWSIFGW